MKKIVKQLPRFLYIYNQLYDNPFIPLYKIAAAAKVSRSTISRDLKKMYELGIFKGPLIFLKPAHNYKRYASFLQFNNAYTIYKGLKGFPNVVTRSLNGGFWNVLLTCERLMDFSQLIGFNQCVFQGVKGVTWLSKVTSLDWELSLEKMYNQLVQPEKKSTLYKEVPSIFWNKKEWNLYFTFWPNVNMKVVQILKEYHISFRRYQKWISQLTDIALITPAFYPLGVESYFMIDFLFESQYHKQLAAVLGMLPSTSAFFSVGDNLFARLCVSTKKEYNGLLSFIYELGEYKYFTAGYQAHVISSALCGDNYGISD